MGELNMVFAAPDDAAAVELLDHWLGGQPVHRDDGLGPEALAELEALLTGRDSQQIAADPRHCARIDEILNEDAGVAEAGLVTVTSTLTQALAMANDEALIAAATAWSHGEYAIRGLAAVARHAAAHDQRMYNFWYF
jgi:hypothetical protein